MISVCIYDSNFSYWDNVWVLYEHSWTLSASVNRKEKILQGVFNYYEFVSYTSSSTMTVL